MISMTGHDAVMDNEISKVSPTAAPGYCLERVPRLWFSEGKPKWNSISRAEEYRVREQTG